MDSAGLNRNGNFWKLWVGLSVSSFGDVLLTIWSITVVAREPNSAFYVALIFMSGVLPDLLFTLFSGSVADYVDSRKLLSVTSLVQIVLLLFLVPGILYLEGSLVWLIIVVNVFQSIANTLYNSANQVILPQIVDSSHLQMANARIKLSSEIFTLAGYSVGGLFLLFISPVVVIVADAASFLVVAILAVCIKVKPRDVSPEGRTPSMSFAFSGVRFIIGNRSLRVLLLWAFFASLSVAPFMVALPDVIKALDHFDSMLLSWHFMAISIGSILASTVVSIRVPKNHLLILLGTGGGLYIAILIMSLCRSVELTLFACFLFGVVSLLSSVVLISVVQRDTPQELMGRVCSGFGFVVQLGLPPAFLLVGLLSSRFGMSNILFVSSFGIVFSTVLLVSDQLWDFTRLLMLKAKE